MTTNTGGPAFPTSFDTLMYGVTMRDYFAAKAMQAIISTDRAQEPVDEYGCEMGCEDGDYGTLFIHTRFLADEAYVIADAMLKAREVVS